MEQTSSLEANSHSASQEIPRLLWHPKVHYHVHKSLPLVPVLNHMLPVHTFSNYFPNIHSNTVFTFTLRSSAFSSFHIFQPNYCNNFSTPHACYMNCTSHSSWLDHTNNIWYRVQVMKLLIMQSSSDFCHFHPLRSKYSPQHPFPKNRQSMFFL
jgi:hypothetical protein